MSYNGMDNGVSEEDNDRKSSGNSGLRSRALCR